MVLLKLQILTKFLVHHKTEKKETGANLINALAAKHILIDFVFQEPPQKIFCRSYNVKQQSCT